MGILTGEQLRGICEMMLRVNDDSFLSHLRDLGRTNASQKDCPDSDDDEDEEEEEVQCFRQSACNCVSAVMEHHPDLFAVQGLPITLTMMQKLIEPQRKKA